MSEILQGLGKGWDEDEQTKQRTQLWRQYQKSIVAMNLSISSPALPLPLPLDKAMVAGPTVGVRVWIAVRAELRAISSNNVVWPTGSPLAARCIGQRAHVSPPAQGCQCGAWAFKRGIPFAIDSYRSQGETLVMGHVALWGRVIEHEQGYRAQYAYPIALWPYQPTLLPPGFPRPKAASDQLAQLGEAYGVPVYERQPS